ncbi:MAG: hypothetical protein WCP52_09895 [Bacteroidota bacterium]
MKRNLFLSSFLFVLLAGCSLGHYSRLKEVSPPAEVLKPIFGDNFTSFLFKTNISIYNKEISGLLLTKQMSSGDYRIIFTTELGMKMFDFEFKDTSFTLQYCVPQFNRPTLLKTLKNDIEMLLMNNISSMHRSYYSNKDETEMIHRVRMEKLSTYYFVEKATQQIYKIERSSKVFKKVTISLNDYKEGVPTNIVIQHNDIKLKIELNLLKR